MNPEKSMFWHLHKKFKNKFLLSAVIAIQKIYLNKHDKILNRYQEVIIDPALGKNFILEHKRLIVNIHGKNLYRELIINYRTRYGSKNPDKVFNDFVQYIVSKTVSHTSDVAIAHNILKNFNLGFRKEVILIDFIVSRVGHNFPRQIVDLENTKFLNMKKKLVIDQLKKLKIVTQ